jgi:hypothetical protein
MGSEGKMALAYESNLATGTGHPADAEGVRRERQLEIAVVFTSIGLTAQVMKEAGLLANQIGARITLIVPQVVPWPLQLSTPPVLLDFHEARFRAIANRTGVPTDVRIYLCRDRIPTVEQAIQHGTIVMIGVRKRFWPTAERRLAWALRRRGHQVIVSELED